MKKLTIVEIRQFSERPFVRKTAVENFLATMGTNSAIALKNLALDARLYSWDDPTLDAIMEGIVYAQLNNRTDLIPDRGGDTDD